VRNVLTTSAALLCLLQVFSMRWNIVIGGQLMSKSLRGLRAPYDPEVYGREGILAAIALFITPFVILYVFDRLLGIDEEPGSAGAHGAEVGADAKVPSTH
jgi:ABC-type Fe3+ transport system permease subunit